MNKVKELTGKRFTLLTVIKRLGSNKHGAAVWLCKCDCGTEKPVSANSLNRNKTLSCGCLGLERRTKAATKHGKHGSPEYVAWTGMKNRRYKKSQNIKICDRWLIFDNFYKDMGCKPPNKILSRLDMDEGYYPNNCAWLTRSENARKRKVVILEPKVCKISRCENEMKSLGLCIKHYTRQRKHGTTETTVIIGNDKKRLKNNSKVNKDGCWIWQKSRKLGYGTTFLRGGRTQAHRAAWMVFVGEIPSKLQVNHKCHVRACINPKHLYLGTQKQNMKDMDNAGRRNAAVGSGSGMAKLDEKKVIEIKKMLDLGEKLENIANKFNVSASCIRSIKQEKTWLHV